MYFIRILSKLRIFLCIFGKNSFLLCFKLQKENFVHDVARFIGPGSHKVVIFLSVGLNRIDRSCLNFIGHGDDLGRNLKIKVMFIKF